MAYPETLSELTNYPKALSHAGAGGGVNLKTLNIVNNLNAALFVNNCISDGYYGEIKVAPDVATATFETGAA